MNRLSALSTILVLLVTHAPAQIGGSVVIPAQRATNRGNVTTIFPFHQSSPTSERQQWCYDIGAIVAESGGTLVHGALVTELYVRASGALAAFCFERVRIRVATTAIGLDFLTNDLDANLQAAMVKEVRYGAPWSSGPVPLGPCCVAPWIPLGLDEPFVLAQIWPVGTPRTLILDLEVCDDTMGWTSSLDCASWPGSTRFARTVDCTGNRSQGTTQDFTPILKFDWRVGSPTCLDWQRDLGPVDLNIDGLRQDSDCEATRAIRFRTGVNQPFTINFGAPTLVGRPFVLFVVGAPAVSARAGGLTTANGQILNLDFRDPTFSAGPGVAIPAMAALPLAFPFPVPPVSMQLLVADPGSPDGFVLSPAVQFEVVGGC